MNHEPIASSSLKTRLRAHLGLKLSLVLGLNLLAFVPYFWLQRNVFFPINLMTETSLDVWFGFSPQAVWLYLSLFLLMPIAPMQMQTRRQLWRYALGVAAMSLTADLVFLIWPTAVVRPTDAEANGIYSSLVGLDLPLNAFPSLHAAMAVFSTCCLEQIIFHLRRQGILRGVLWCWALAIIGAMLLVKQHVALDAMGGIVLGLGSYYWAFRYLSLREKQFRLETKTVRREGWTI